MEFEEQEADKITEFSSNVKFHADEVGNSILAEFLKSFRC